MNDEPPVNPNNWLHHALVGLHAWSKIPSWVLAAGIAVIATLIGWAWRLAHSGVLAQTMAITWALFVGADWAWLYALPRLKLSFGPVKPPLIGLIAVRLCISLGALLAPLLGVEPPYSGIIAALLHAALSVAIWYATGIEPFRLGVTHLELHSRKLEAGRRVRLVHLSDLHIERLTRRERELLARVNALHADYILLTGDYLNFSYISEARAVADARRVLGQLQARKGIFAVRGTHQVDPNALLPVLFAGTSIRWLRSEHVTTGQKGRRMTFAGASCTREPDIDVPAVERALSGKPDDVFTVLLYHTPDLVAQAAEQGVDLYLAGHTHGGQLRLPVYGALMTATEVGKQYEMGRYDLDGLTLYVSRGIGMEGMAAPRARFMCPPEIVCIDVLGGTDEHPI